MQGNGLVSLVDGNSWSPRLGSRTRGCDGHRSAGSTVRACLRGHRVVSTCAGSASRVGSLPYEVANSSSAAESQSPRYPDPLGVAGTGSAWLRDVPGISEGEAARVSRYATATLLLALSLSLAACSSGTSTAAKHRPISTTTSTTAASPSPSISVSYFYVSMPPNSYFRFAAPVTNPGAQTIVGVVVTCIAYDSSGAMVGSFTHHMPPVAANSTLVYVGGAGSALLSGTPARVSAQITRAGQYTSEATTPFTVSSAQFSQAESNDSSAPPGDLTYEVTADVTITGSSSVQTANLDIPIVLTDSTGKIVGADFYRPENLSPTLGPGTSFAVDDDNVIATSTPTTVTIYANVDPG